MIAVLILWAAPTYAAPACPERGIALKHLFDKYKETPAAMGLANNGSVLEVLTSPKGETWTILMTQPNGLTCMLATGTFWQNIERLKGEAGS